MSPTLITTRREAKSADPIKSLVKVGKLITTPNDDLATFFYRVVSCRNRLNAYLAMEE